MKISLRPGLLWLALLHVPMAHAQDYFHSLHSFSSLTYFPASAAVDNQASVTYHNRSVAVAPGVSFMSNGFLAEYPLILKESGKRYGGIGIQFVEKDAGGSDLLKSHSYNVSLGYNVQLTKRQFIALGIQPSYYNKSTSIQNYTTGSQWLANEFRFDPGLAIGEAFAVNRVNYFGVNAGFNWYVENDEPENKHRAFFSLTAFNLNRPTSSFLENQNRLPIGYLAQAGATMYHTKSFRFTPRAIAQLDGSRTSFNLIASSTFKFINSNPFDVIQSGSVEFHTNYNFKSDLATGIAVHQPGFSFGFSYNFSLSGSTANQYFKNGMEWGVSLKKTIWKEKVKTVIIDESPTATKRHFDLEKPSTNQQPTMPPMAEPETTVIQKNIEAYSKVKAVHFQLDKNFHFQYGMTELDDEAKNYLNELSELLKANPDYHLDVIGHTDNVGKPLVNYRLSLGRAQSVVDYLISKGIARERLKYSGRGDTDPIDSNDTDEGRAKNRRVQFIIYMDK